MVNVIVLWNTLYMDAALNQLRAEGYDVRDEDVARLSPLGHEHINMLGRYAFTLPETVARGGLRPLRDSRSAGDEPDGAGPYIGVPFRCAPDPKRGVGAASVHRSAYLVRDGTSAGSTYVVPLGP